MGSARSVRSSGCSCNVTADGQASSDLWLPDDAVAVISMTYDIAADFIDMTADRRVWTRLVDARVGLVPHERRHHERTRVTRCRTPGRSPIHFMFAVERPRHATYASVVCRKKRSAIGQT